MQAISVSEARQNFKKYCTQRIRIKAAASGIARITFNMISKIFSIRLPSIFSIFLPAFLKTFKICPLGLLFSTGLVYHIRQDFHRINF